MERKHTRSTKTMWAVEEILKNQRIKMQQTSHLPPFDTYKLPVLGE